MFETTILESIEGAPSTRRWSALASFTLQAFSVAVLLIAPLIFTQQLPQIRYFERLSAPASSAPERVMPIVSSHVERSSSRSELRDGVLVEPTAIPITTRRFVDQADSPIGSSVLPGIPYGIPSADRDSVINSILATTRTTPPIAVEPRREPLKVSSLSEGMIVRRVQPIYPEIARLARVQGPVVIAAVIDTNGRITSLRLVSGHPMLVDAAMEALRQWRYRPYVLNGQPIQVETQVTIMFTLR